MTVDNSTDGPLGARTPAPSDTAPDAPLAAPVSPEDTALGIEEVAHDQAPEDFDFTAFIEGSRPGRRRVTLSMRGDLIAVMEAAVTRAEQAEKVGDQDGLDRAVADYEQAKATYEANRRPIVVEARGTEWLQNIEKQAKKQHGLDPKKAQDRITIMLRQIAGQIVHPTKGVTVEALRHLYETNEPEIDKLWRACQSANRGTSVMPDFSHRPSATSPRG